MNKRLVDEYSEFVFKGERTPFSLGTLVVVVFCTVLLIVATFTKLDIQHYWFANGLDGFQIVLKKYQFVPQIPVVLLIAALLGVRFGLLVLVLYLLAGFFLYPVFAFGGGVEYVKSYFFGYILGFFAANIFAGNILSHKYGLKNIFTASVIGVLAIHVCGILYSFILSFFNFSTYTPNFKLVFVQILYDIVFSLIVVLLAKPLKYVLWIGMKNEPKKIKTKEKVY